MKRPIQGGPPLRREERIDGDVVAATEVGSAFEAEAAVALAESYGIRASAMSVAGRTGFGGIGTNLTPHRVWVHVDDLAAVREIFEAHGIDSSRPAGLPWRGALVATAALVGFAIVLVVATALRS